MSTKQTKEDLVSRQEQYISTRSVEKLKIHGKKQDRCSFISIKDIPIDSGVEGKLLEVIEMPNKLGKKGETKPVLKLETKKGNVFVDCIHTIKEALGDEPQSFIGKNLYFVRKGEAKTKRNKMMQLVEVYEI